MTTPLERGGLRRIPGSRFVQALAAFSLVAASCSSSQTQAPSISVQALDGWQAIDNPVAVERVSSAMEGLAAQAPAGRPSSEDEALGGARPGVRVVGGTGRWAETVLRFGSDGKPATSPELEERAQDPAAADAFLVRRSQGTTSWQAVNLPSARARAAVAEMATATRGDLVALMELGPRAADAVRRAAAAAARDRGVALSLVELESVEEVTWPNSALGLPQPGMLYTMALVPGHRVKLRLPGGLGCLVHTSARQALVAPAASPAAAPLGASESPR